jgi:GNAT superfamily N-acetyltransferase
MEVWGPERVADLAGLTTLAMPAERLTADELLACCWDDPGVVLGLPGGEGAVSVAVRDRGDRPVGCVKLLAVAPAVQGLGRGRELLDAAHTWAFDQGATEIRAGESVPHYLWPGVDMRMTRALCLFESAGYWPVGANFNMSCPTTHRAAAPDGVAVRRALADEDGAAVVDLAAREWPTWVDEVTAAVEHGSCHGAFVDHAAIGFGCHSVNRAGWVGPMGTDPGRQHRGVGSALLGEVCKDLMTAGFPDAEIAWVGPVGFYAKSAGAAVSRVFRSLVLPRR